MGYNLKLPIMSTPCLLTNLFRSMRHYDYIHPSLPVIGIGQLFYGYSVIPYIVESLR